jgi:hypothetical protein
METWAQRLLGGLVPNQPLNVGADISGLQFEVLNKPQDSNVEQGDTVEVQVRGQLRSAVDGVERTITVDERWQMEAVVEEEAVGTSNEVTISWLWCGTLSSATTVADLTPTETPDATQTAVALATSVQMTVDAALAAQQPDVADPNANVQQIQPATNQDTACTIPQVKVKSNFSSVNVRRGPSTRHEVVRVLPAGAVVNVTGKNENNTNPSWWEFALPDGTRVWVAASVTEPVCQEALNNVPVAANIPPPPATATHTPTPSPTTATQATITVVNNSNFDLCNLLIDPSFGPWTINRLDNPLPSGSQRSFQFPAGIEYDFATDACGSGETVHSEFNIFVGPSGFAWIVPVFEVPITVVNNSNLFLCELFIDPSAGPSTVNLVGGSSLEPGSQVTFQFPAGIEYDIKTDACETFERVFDEFNVLVGPNGFTWSIPIPGAPGTITVTSQQQTLCELYISRSADPDWGINLLSGRMSPNTPEDWQVHPVSPWTLHDLRAVSCDSNVAPEEIFGFAVAENGIAQVIVYQ